MAQRLNLRQTGVKLLFMTGITSIPLVTPVAFGAESSVVLEEVIVTATKRAENVHDVPISIAVVSGETIEALGIEDIKDLQSFVPGLTVQKTFGNWAVRVRGLGSGVTNLAFDSSVSIFNDGVYCGRSRCLEAGFLDSARVEVAKGPQGALFGKSTIAGAISVVSARPTDEFEAYINAGLELDEGGYVVRGAISGPINDVLRARFAFKTEDLDGFIDNETTGDDDEAVDAYALRLGLEWDVSDSMLASFKYERSDNRVEGRSNQLVSSPGPFGFFTVDQNPEFRLDTTRRVSSGVSGEEQDYDEAESDSFTFKLDAELGEHTLSLIANYWELESETYLDVDGLPDLFINTTITEDYDQQSFEARLLSPADQMFEYIVGALYLTTDTVTRQHSPLLFPFLGNTIPAGGDRNFERESDTFSIYGQLVYNATDRLKVILDLRYTDERQDGFAHSFPVIYNDGFTPISAPGTGNSAEFRLRQKRKDDSLDPSIRALYQFNDDINFYIAYAEGSKPGGLKANDGALGNLLLGQNPSLTPAELISGVTLQQGNGIFDFEDEKAKNFEIGSKMFLLGGAASLHVTLFDTEFDNLQTSAYDGATQSFIIGNAGSASIRGIELEGAWQVMNQLKIGGSAVLLDAEYDEFLGAVCLIANAAGDQVDPSCTGGDGDLSGHKLERTPDWELNLWANWESQISDALVFRGLLSAYFSDDYNVRLNFHPLGEQNNYSKWDLRLALASAEDTWEVAVVGRNLTDELVIQHAYGVVGSNFASISRGRSVMLEASVRF